RAEQEVSRVESPIDPEVIQRRVADAQPAFETCLQQEMRRNPSFRAGRTELVLTVMPSGVVRQAGLSDRALDDSNIGRCISLAARRIMLPSFGGEEPVEIVLPLVLTPSR
ncbi:MAG: AgmX/PglI C-terminal domain-containing protein, partial [Myxococcota bacterium]